MIKDIRKVKIWIAGVKDLKEIKRLINYLMKVEGVDNIKKQTDLIIKQRIKSTFSGNKNKVFIAEYNKKPIGLAVVEIKYGLVASVPYLVVFPNYQKLGIGKQLINYTAKYVKKQKIRILEVLIYKDNKKSRKFHEKLGFHLFGFVLRKKI